MLTNNSIQIIQGLSEVSSKMVIEYPMSTIKNVTGDVYGIVHFDKINEKFPTFAIWDTSSFLSALSILENPKISLKDNILTAQDDYSTINYVTSSPSICGDATCDPRIVTSTINMKSVVDLNMPIDVIARIKKGVNVFKTLKDLCFEKVGDTFTVSTTNKETFNASNNSFSLKLDADNITGEDFKIYIPADNFLKLPSMDYVFRVHEKDGAHRISMTNDIFEFVLSLKRN